MSCHHLRPFTFVSLDATTRRDELNIVQNQVVMRSIHFGSRKAAIFFDFLMSRKLFILGEKTG